MLLEGDTEVEAEKIRLLIVEDEGLFRDMLHRSLSPQPNLEVVGAVADGIAAIEAADELKPHVVLMDIELGSSISGIEAAFKIKANQPDTGIVILSMHKDKQYIASLPKGKAGGWSYLLKQSVDDIPALVRAIEGSAAGFMVLDPAIVDGLRPTPGSLVDKLTPRHRELLELMAKGYNNASIADKLVITKKAVENYINTIFQELGITKDEPVHPRVMAVLIYLQETHGW
jgi:DNA-binding NarL/FixJ family response regulator